MKQVAEAAKLKLKTANKQDMAHLVALELPGSEGAFAYYTDYFRDLTYDGKVYKSGILKSVGNVKQTKTFGTFTTAIKVSGLIQNEIDRAMESRSFINKSIIVYRVFLDDMGDIIPVFEDGTSMRYFEGNITTLSVDDDISATKAGSSAITWNCSSVLSNFEAVNGRITDDTSHRGLVTVNGQQQPSGAAKRPEYQTDKGFAHANQSISVLANYQTQEKRYKVESKRAGGFRGLVGGRNYRMVEYWETVTKSVDMDINLTAKYIPVVYGVQKTPGVPVFVDTLADNPNEVWVVYAFCEGEIDGFLDFYLNDAPIICVDDKEDPEKRVCLGTKRVEGHTISLATPSVDARSPSVHGQHYIYNDGVGDIEFWTFHGKYDQEASEVLVDLANNKRFYLQKGRDGYWDENYKLLDTAYAVFKFTLSDERTTLPQVSAEVQGRKVRVYDEAGNVTSDKTSLNFCWQALDYMTNDIFGAGIPLHRVDIGAVRYCASLHDIVDTSYTQGWAPYWRYLGWTDWSKENRQIMQGSGFFDTSETVYRNLNALLDQADLSLNIISGDYVLTTEAQQASVVDLSIDDIVDGKVQVTDDSEKNKFNSVQASISDPAMGWNTNTVTFFNSEYKAQDGNKEKKGNFVFPFITNYYTARSRSERLLKRSRYTKMISFRLPFFYFYIKTNDHITMTIPRYGWDKEKFIIQDLNWTPDGKVQVTARHYEEGIFINSEQSDVSDGQIPDINVNLLPVRDVTYSPDTVDDIVGLNGRLSWIISPSKGVTYYTVRQTGRIDPYIVTVTGNEPVDSRVGLDLYDLPEGQYTFEVKAVNVLGDTSKGVKLTVDINSTKNLSLVPNFRVVNLAINSSYTFVGSDLQLAWDAIPEHDDIVGIAYNIQILNKNDIVLHDVTVSNAFEYSYTLATNKADFQATEGSLGVNRQLKARIKATGSGGESSVQWVNV